MATEYVRICPHCKLVFRPDERIYKDAHQVCPRCGKKLVKDSDNEQND